MATNLLTQAPAKQGKQGAPPGYAKNTYVPYDERWTNSHGYDIKIKATVADLARKIHNHNLSRGFTSVLLIGDSGSGKTTLRGRLFQELAEGHNYVRKYYKEHEILNLTPILHKLPKYHDYLIGFEDVSFLIKKGVMKEDQLMSMFHELTKVRHTVKGRVIATFNIHYPYAIEKFMRQAGYRILTSITDDEREIYIKLFGPQSRPIIEQFLRDDRYQTEESQFYLPDRTGKPIKFIPKQPFKLALASRMGDLTFLVYDKPTGIFETEGNDQDASAFDPHWVKTQEAKYNYKRFLRVTRWFAFMQTGMATIQKDDRALYNAWLKYAENNHIDYKALIAILKQLPHIKDKLEREIYFNAELEQLLARQKAGNQTEPLQDSELAKDADKEPDTTEDLDDDQDDDGAEPIFKQFGIDNDDDQDDDSEGDQ